MIKTFEGLLEDLPKRKGDHVPGSPGYAQLRGFVRDWVVATFGKESGAAPQPFPPFGDISFPYRTMGAIDSLDLFGLDELIIFSFYWANRKRYGRTIDIGANIGLHTLVMSRCGFETRSFEPDPETFATLGGTLKINGCSRAVPVNMAVSDHVGKAEFVRVLGNTTGSHLAGAKANPYGDLQRFQVSLESIANLRGKADLFKIDAEGHETVILGATDKEFWSSTDALVEVGTPENAAKVFAHLSSLGVNMFSQKVGWKRARLLADIPTSYKEGTLFISRREEMPWA